jgi:hypothetical protein
MSILSTPTPAYQGQETTPPQPSQGFLAWLKSLFQTPTPVYRIAPVPSEPAQAQRAKEPER